MGLLWILLAGAAIAGLYFSARRAITIVELSVTGGVMRVVRGGIAPPILADLRDVAKSPPIAALQIRIVRASGRAELHFTGKVSPAQEQQIRNVVGSVPLARLVNAAKRVR